MSETAWSVLRRLVGEVVRGAGPLVLCVIGAGFPVAAAAGGASGGVLTVAWAFALVVFAGALSWSRDQGWRLLIEATLRRKDGDAS